MSSSAFSTARVASGSPTFAPMHRRTPIDNSQRAFVEQKRRERCSWDAIGRMLGAPADSVRRAFDPTYEPLHTPAAPVAGGLSRSRLIAVLAEGFGLPAEQARLLAELHRATEPLAVDDLFARAEVMAAGTNEHHLRHEAGRFRVALAVREVELQTGKLGYRLTAQGRALVEAVIKAATQ